MVDGSVTVRRMALSALFDLDGTLTDPGEGFVKCITHALAGVNSLGHSPSEIRKHVGPPLEETLRKLLDGDDTKLAAAVALYRERYGIEGYLENAVYPGIQHALEELSAKRIALFVATSKPTVFAKRILEHFRLAPFFQGIHGSELDGTNSNKAHLIAHLLRKESVDPSRTLMIGDRAHDVIGALANGVHPIGALWGYGTKEELVGAGAREICAHPTQLVNVLTSNNRARPTWREQPGADQER